MCFRVRYQCSKRRVGLTGNTDATRGVQIHMLTHTRKRKSSYWSGDPFNGVETQVPFACTKGHLSSIRFRNPFLRSHSTGPNQSGPGGAPNRFFDLHVTLWFIMPPPQTKNSKATSQRSNKNHGARLPPFFFSLRAAFCLVFGGGFFKSTLKPMGRTCCFWFKLMPPIRWLLGCGHGESLFGCARRFGDGKAFRVIFLLRDVFFFGGDFWSVASFQRMPKGT